MLRGRLLAIATLGIVLSVATSNRVADAIGFTWIAGDGDWHVPQFWTPFSPPVMGPPGLGDAATISGNRNVTLSANAFGLAGLLVQAQADLLTNTNQLTIVNINGTASAAISGTGTTGNNTELFVHPVGGNTPGLIADNLNLLNGGELDLTNGGITHITNRLDVDAISIITGDGTIVFTDTHNVLGRRLDLQGTIRPDASDTITLVAESGTIDLDGFVHNDNLVDLTNTGSELTVDGEMTDSFTGTIQMGADSTLHSTAAWELGPTDGGAGGSSLISVDAGTGSATISGGELTLGGEFGFIDVLTGTMLVTADATIRSNSDIDVFNDAELQLGSASSTTIIEGGSWNGSGAVNLDAGLTTIAADTTVDMPFGTFDIDGNTTSDTVTINRRLTLNVASVDDNDFNRIDGHTIINGAFGQLIVNLNALEPGYRFEGLLELNGPGGAVTGVHLAGTDVELAGTTMVTGNSTTLAQVTITGSVDIAAGGIFGLTGGSSENPNVIRNTATFSGAGKLLVSPGAQLNIEDGTSISADVLNLGRFEPGLSIGSVELTHFVQNAGGTLGMEIDGAPGPGQDHIMTSGSSQVAGALEVTVLDGFVPTLGQIYTLILASSVSGTFSDFTLLSNSPFEYEATLSYPGSRVALQFTDVSLTGDFVENLNLDCEDIDALVAEIAGGSVNLDFDLNGDGIISNPDLDEWLDIAGSFNVGGPYLGGDANLDGLVDGQDFLIWNANKFTNTPAWCSGDFNADGAVDGQDFLIWNGNKFMASDQVVAVPEPQAIALYSCCLVLITIRRRN